MRDASFYNRLSLPKHLANRDTRYDIVPMKRQFTTLTLKDVDDYEKNSLRLDVGRMLHCIYVTLCVCFSVFILFMCILFM